MLDVTNCEILFILLLYLTSVKHLHIWHYAWFFFILHTLIDLQYLHYIIFSYCTLSHYSMHRYGSTIRYFSPSLSYIGFIDFIYYTNIPYFAIIIIYQFITYHNYHIYYYLLSHLYYYLYFQYISLFNIVVK